MIFKDIAGPTGYAKRNMSGYVTSAFELIIDRHIMNTETIALKPRRIEF